MKLIAFHMAYIHKRNGMLAGMNVKGSPEKYCVEHRQLKASTQFFLRGAHPMTHEKVMKHLGAFVGVGVGIGIGIGP